MPEVYCTWVGCWPWPYQAFGPDLAFFLVEPDRLIPIGKLGDVDALEVPGRPHAVELLIGRFDRVERARLGGAALGRAC